MPEPTTKTLEGNLFPIYSPMSIFLVQKLVLFHDLTKVRGTEVAQRMLKNRFNASVLNSLPK